MKKLSTTQRISKLHRALYQYVMIRMFALFVFANIVVNDVWAKPPQRLIGGSDAVPGEVPFQVSLRLNGHHSCGGALLSTRHVLTAAHCVAEVLPPYGDLTVVTGTNSLEKGGEVWKIDDIEVHENFSSNSDGSFTNDIAVITLHGSVQVNTYQSPIALPEGDTKDHVVGLVSGWGQTAYDDYPDGDYAAVLQKSDMTILTHDECQRLHKLNTIGYENLCGFKNSFSGVCKGDDGSPLAYNGTVIGISSWYYPCGIGLPDVYVKVYHYLDWILNNMSAVFHSETKNA